MSSVEDGRALWNSSGPKIGTRDENWTLKRLHFVRRRAHGRARAGLVSKREIDQGGKSWQSLLNLFVIRAEPNTLNAYRVGFERYSFQNEDQFWPSLYMGSILGPLGYS